MFFYVAIEWFAITREFRIGPTDAKPLKIETPYPPRHSSTDYIRNAQELNLLLKPKTTPEHFRYNPLCYLALS